MTRALRIRPQIEISQLESLGAESKNMSATHSISKHDVSPAVPRNYAFSSIQTLIFGAMISLKGQNLNELYTRSTA